VARTISWRFALGIAEPLFLGLDATIKAHAVMTPEDLGTAIPAIEQAAQRYG